MVTVRFDTTRATLQVYGQKLGGRIPSGFYTEDSRFYRSSRCNGGSRLACRVRRLSYLRFAALG